jgi:hypothetical protein
MSDDFMGQLAIPVAGVHKHRFSGWRSLLRSRVASNVRLVFYLTCLGAASRRESISGALYFEISVTNTSAFSTERTLGHKGIWRKSVGRQGCLGPSAGSFYPT